MYVHGYDKSKAASDLRIILWSVDAPAPLAAQAELNLKQAKSRLGILNSAELLDVVIAVRADGIVYRGPRETGLTPDMPGDDSHLERWHGRFKRPLIKPREPSEQA